MTTTEVRGKPLGPRTFTADEQHFTVDGTTARARAFLDQGIPETITTL